VPFNFLTSVKIVFCLPRGVLLICRRLPFAAFCRRFFVRGFLPLVFLITLYKNLPGKRVLEYDPSSRPVRACFFCVNA
jgi:hypothetical protein